jgi:hypothetical protein
VGRDPQQFGIPGTRWTLAKIHQVCDWLRTTTPAGLCRLLKRLHVSRKRGRDHIHSPDPDYLTKLASIAVWVHCGQISASGRIVTLYLDELTYYRQPTLAPAYTERGCGHQPYAERSVRSNTATRILGALNVRDGRVFYHQGSRIRLADIVTFYRTLVTAYPQAARLYVIQDNWPQHFHPDVLVALEPQQCRWPYYRPPSWSDTPSAEAVRRWGKLRLPIQALPLPTYAPWENPIEKLWRKLKQNELHLHRLADHLEELRARVVGFLDQYAGGSDALLDYVGLRRPPARTRFNC